MFHHLFPNNRLLLMHVITTISSLIAIASTSSSSNSSVSTLPHPHPDLVAIELQMQVESSRRRALSALKSSRKDQQCLTGNPIDDCWRCSGVDWLSDRQRLADCGIGFGRGALGGKGGPFYVVTDPSDGDAVNPAPGTLRYGALQDGPLWITFAGDMTIRLNQVLMVNSLKTIDGRGAEVHIAGGACITIQEVSNVIIHNVHVHDCVPAGGANVRSSPNHYEWRSKSDGDGISIHSSRNVWVDHCSLSNCADGLIDVTVGSTGITISNSFFSHHDKVMLLGHSDDYTADSGMQVTVAFNRFGQQLVQRMPRCRFGYFHVVNNDYTGWEMYAVGGSANPTINSQGNRYIAPADSNAKEVTKRVDTDESQWEGWDWRSEGDVMVNGAYFVASGQGMAAKYAMASSVEPLSAALIDQLTMNAGVLGAPGDKSAGTGYSGGGGPTNSGGNAGTGYSGGVADGGEPTNSGVNAGGGSVGSTPVYGYGPYYGPQYGPFGMVFHSGASRSYGLLFFGICCTYILPFFSLLREL